MARQWDAYLPVPFPTLRRACAQAVSARRSASVSRSASGEPGGFGRQVGGGAGGRPELAFELPLERGRVIGAGDGAEPGVGLAPFPGPQRGGRRPGDGFVAAGFHDPAGPHGGRPGEPAGELIEAGDVAGQGAGYAVLPR